MDIKLITTGNHRCQQFESSVKEALQMLDLKIKIQKIADVPSMIKYNILTTPTLLINGKVISRGKFLKTEEIIELLTYTLHEYNNKQEQPK
jgi:hypothetical protein